MIHYKEKGEAQSTSPQKMFFISVMRKYLSPDYMVTRKKRAVKRTAITVTTISFLVYLPVKSVMRVYAIAPIAIPLEIE